MLEWAIIFLVIAIVASLFGFKGIANVSAKISKFIFLIIAIIIILIIVLGAALL